MCEHFVARAAEPFRLDELWPFTERLERFGIAGLRLGRAWLGDDGALARPPRHPRVPRRPGARGGRRHETTRASSTSAGPRGCRRSSCPTRSRSTIPAGRFAFSHNGDLRDYQGARAAYRGQGRIHGRADTEVGPALARGRLATTRRAADLLARAPRPVRRRQANLAVLTRRRRGHHYAGNRENPVFTFRLGPDRARRRPRIYSLDRSLFRFAAPGATNGGSRVLQHDRRARRGRRRHHARTGDGVA